MNLKINAAPVMAPKTSVDIVKQDDPDMQFFRGLESKNIILNEKQIDAVRFTNHDLLVSASPGSGKSLVIVAKVAYLIKIIGVAPENILVITYTKRASEELRRRLHDMDISDNIMARTIHSLCYQILRQNLSDKIKLITDDTVRISIMKKVLAELDMEQYLPEDMLLQISRIKNKIGAADEGHPLYPVFKQFNGYLKENKLMDFDRMLILAYNLLISNPRLLSLIQSRFKYILIDEAQDLTMLQMKIIQMIAAPKENIICCVGDPKQSIYGFCGSDNAIITNFKSYFPNLHEISLDVNYRNPASIIGLASELIQQCMERQEVSVVKYADSKPIIFQPSDCEAEAEFIVNCIRESVQSKTYAYDDFCILYRSFNSARAIYEKLIFKDIPFVQPNRQRILYTEDCIKPIIDHIRLSIDPHEMNALINIMPSLYLNKVSVSQYVNQMLRRNNSKSLLDILPELPDLREFQYEKIRDRIELIRQLDEMCPVDAIKAIRQGGIDKFYKLQNLLSLQSQIIADQINDLEESASQFVSISQFLNYIDELIQKAERAKQNVVYNAVNLMSIHSSKGLQFNNVFIIGAIESVIPHRHSSEPSFMPNATRNLSEDLDEECRVLYVGITRSEQNLYISIPKSFHNKPTVISRFLAPFIQSK